ncbi:hypothetical protein TNCV_2531641 [Trichonephila clavipes]|nr:hypothetical protein TNCV_2531641 [Trichonephila clavipes]
MEGGYTSQSKNVLVHHPARTIRSVAQWPILLASTPEEMEILHTCSFLQPCYGAPNSRIRLAIPLFWLIVLPKTTFIAIFTF